MTVNRIDSYAAASEYVNMIARRFVLFGGELAVGPWKKYGDEPSAGPESGAIARLLPVRLNMCLENSFGLITFSLTNLACFCPPNHPDNSLLIFPLPSTSCTTLGSAFGMAQLAGKISFTTDFTMLL
jgi:hypothetical protein